MQPIQPNQMTPQAMQQMPPQVQSPPPAPPGEVNIKTGGYKFTVVKDDSHAPLPTDIMVDNTGSAVDSPKKKRGRPKKSDSVVIAASSAHEDKPGDIPTMYTYQETTDMLRGTLAQIDQLAGQVKHELDSVASSRTLKSKYNIMVGLSGNLGDIINTKITAIKEINNAISKSNEMDYKKEKDRKAAEAGVNDDKYLMDMYNAFIQNPANVNTRTVLGPTSMDATLGAPNIIRASTDQVPQQGFNPDNGYLSYVTNMTPEQRLMALEDNPNIKMCVVFDAATGNKTFQMMDMSTGQALPGLPVRDPMFMEDTTIDLRNNIAKNINLNETYPLVVINQQVAKEY
jgi:hypothetical protein